MSDYKLVPLCRCNKCMRIFEDTNPQDNAHKFKVPTSVEKLETKDDMKACPYCETDGYLSDVGLAINTDILIEDEFSIMNELLRWCEQGILQSKQLNLDDKKKCLFTLNIEFIKK